MASRQVREADFWVGIEAGIEDDMTFAWIVIEHKQIRGESRSASIMIPEKFWRVFVKAANSVMKWPF